jgi:hypothetical protein
VAAPRISGRVGSRHACQTVVIEAIVDRPRASRSRPMVAPWRRRGVSHHRCEMVGSSSRLSALADYLRTHPEAIDALAAGRAPDEAPAKLVPLFTAPEVARVVNCQEGGALSAQTIRACCGIQDQAPTAELIVTHAFPHDGDPGDTGVPADRHP